MEIIGLKRKRKSCKGDDQFPTGQICNVLPTFLRRAHAENDSLGEGVERVYQLQLRVPAEGDHLVHLFELARDQEVALHELVEPHLAEFVVVAALLVFPRGDHVQLGDPVEVERLLLPVLFDHGQVGRLGGQLLLHGRQLILPLLDVQLGQDLLFVRL